MKLINAKVIKMDKSSALNIPTDVLRMTFNFDERVYDASIALPATRLQLAQVLIELADLLEKDSGVKF